MGMEVNRLGLGDVRDERIKCELFSKKDVRNALKEKIGRKASGMD